MKGLVDIHNHSLYGVDDGAKDSTDMFKMLNCAYQDGVRTICMTPHYNPALFNTESEKIIHRFRAAATFVAQNIPDLQLYFGNEVFYHHDCINNLCSQVCYPLNNGKYVLVEFEPYEDYSNLRTALGNLLNSGYVPVLAHVERYDCLLKQKINVSELARMGVKLQANTFSVLGKSGLRSRFFLKALLKNMQIDVIASDAHDLTLKTPRLKECYLYICKHYGECYADKLFIQNPMKFLSLN